MVDPQTADYAMPNADANACFAMLVDTGGQTPAVNDDMSSQCIDLNYNLELAVTRRPGYPAAAGTVGATCMLAEFPDVTCPGIGG